MRAADGSLQATGWHQIVVTLVDRLKLLSGAGVRVVGSPVLGNEDNGLLARLGAVMGGGDAIFRSPRADDEVVCPGFPGLARRRDLAANVRGLELLGFTRAGDDEGHGGLGNDGGALFVLGDALADQPADFGAGAALFVYMGHTLTAAARNAHFVLPVSLFAEGEGTFTNFEGRVQRFWPGVQPPPLSRPAWQVLGVLLAGLDDAPAPADVASAFLRVAELHAEFSGLSYETIGTRGALVNEPVRLGTGEAG
jgi:hypothetical protein